MLFINAPFGIANGALPVVAPPHLRARVAAVYLLVVSVGMMLGPPIAGLFNEVVFPEADGVRYSLAVLTVGFGFAGVLLLWLARAPYARALIEAESAASEVSG